MPNGVRDPLLSKLLKETQRATPASKILTRVGLPLAIGGGILTAGGLAERAKAAPVGRITSEIERMMDRPLTEAEFDLVGNAYSALKMYAPSVLRHPLVAANYILRVVRVGQLDPSLIREWVDIERRFGEPRGLGGTLLGVVSGLGRVLGDVF